MKWQCLVCNEVRETETKKEPEICCTWPMVHVSYLQCHACQKRWDDGVAFNVRQATCCAKPNIHVHDYSETL